MIAAGGDSAWPRDVIGWSHLIRSEQMAKCTKSQVRRLRTALHWKGDPARRQRIQMVLLREGGMTQPSIAAAMGVSLSTVNRAHMAYDGGGVAALKSKPSGGRKRENMTLAEEKALLARFANAAGAGELLHRSDLDPALLRQNVTSPNGTTFAALQVLMSDNGLARLMRDAVAAAAQRSRELAK